MEVSDKKKIKDHQANLTESINKKELVEKLNVIKVNAAQLSCSNKREGDERSNGKYAIKK